jgi:GR25 family glycosyltransferase involved in LPS biosynthesis
MSSTLGIVAHIKRVAMTEKLADQTGAQIISYDDGTLGCTLNHLNTWKRLSDETTDWKIVLEDDAVPVDGFQDQLAQALEVAPTGIVSLYLGRLRPPQYQYMIQPAITRAEASGAHWLVSRQLLHAVGIAVRADLVDDMLTHLDGETPIDEAINAWVNRKFYRVAYSYPSLVDHADTETLIAHRDGQHREPGRVAWKTGTRDHWENRIVEMN